MPVTTTTVEFAAPIKKVYEVITDFESYPEFLSNSKQAKVLKKSGKNLQVEFKIDVVKTITYTLDMQLNPTQGFTWTLIKGEFMKKNSGGWKLKELKKNLTQATYEIEIDFGLLVPKSISSMLVEKNLPAMMQEFRGRIE